MDFLRNGRLAEALDLMALMFKNKPKMYQDVILFQTRYKNLITEEYKGVITQENARVEKTKIVSNILSWINETKDKGNNRKAENEGLKVSF